MNMCAVIRGKGIPTEFVVEDSNVSLLDQGTARAKFMLSVVNHFDLLHDMSERNTVTFEFIFED